MDGYEVPFSLKALPLSLVAGPMKDQRMAFCSTVQKGTSVLESAIKKTWLLGVCWGILPFLYRDHLAYHANPY